MKLLYKNYLQLLTIAALSLVGLNSCSSDGTGEPDEACTEKTWYEDFDKDGLGNPNKTRLACDQPTGFVENANDNDDLNAENLVIPNSGYSTPEDYAGMTKIWSDEFNSSSLDDTFWSHDLGDGCPNICGWGNNELEKYQKQNVQIVEGNLVITAKRESGNNNYTSSRIKTKGKFSFKYGRVDVRAALPVGKGIWPAIWMLGENIDEVGWPKCGEIDIMEKIGGVGNESTVYGTAHWDNSGQNANFGGNQVVSTNLKDEFHVFSIIWDAEKITWYIDDVEYHVIDTTPSGLSEFQEEFHLLINLAVGGNWPGNPDASTNFSQYLVVDYVRVFQ